MDITLAIFDMDGVIFEGGNFWLDLHELYGTRDQALALASKLLSTSRESDYVYLSNYTADQLWQGKPAKPYYDLIESRVYQPGVGELFEYLRCNNVYTAIISSGAYDLALRAQQDLSIDVVLANKLFVDEVTLNLTGEVEVMVPDNRKDKVGKKLIHRLSTNENLDVDLSKVAFVGDTDSDVSLAKIVSLAIAYNSTSRKLNKVCHYTLKYGDLPKLIHILQDSYPDDLMRQQAKKQSYLAHPNFHDFKSMFKTMNSLLR